MVPPYRGAVVPRRFDHPPRHPPRRRRRWALQLSLPQHHGPRAPSSCGNKTFPLATPSPFGALTVSLLRRRRTMAMREGCRSAMGQRRHAGWSQRHGTVTAPRWGRLNRNKMCVAYLLSSKNISSILLPSTSSRHITDGGIRRPFAKVPKLRRFVDLTLRSLGLNFI